MTYVSSQGRDLRPDQPGYRPDQAEQRRGYPVFSCVQHLFDLGMEPDDKRDAEYGAGRDEALRNKRFERRGENAPRGDERSGGTANKHCQRFLSKMQLAGEVEATVAVV